MQTFKPFILVILLGFTSSCKEQETNHNPVVTKDASREETQSTIRKVFAPSEDFKSYWYSGAAEITSYQLKQARYGELRDGTATLVFVTEDFLPEKQVKADHYNEDNTSVLKLNTNKNFITGVYPYSIMQSTFYPVDNNRHALKVTCSVQEWCGQVYSQLNNRSSFEIKSHSYFESEGDQDFNLDKANLENEIWTQLRIDPFSLPTGSFEMIPSFEFIRLKHIELKAYKASASFNKNSYSITYPDLDRTLTINFSSDFPYEINGWEESYFDGYGQNTNILTTSATKLKTIKSAYWSKNSIKDEVLRETLQLN